MTFQMNGVFQLHGKWKVITVDEIYCNGNQDVSDKPYYLILI